MKLVETRGKVAEDGSIILLPGVLDTMGAEIGDSIALTYFSDKQVQAANSYSRIMLTKDGVEAITEPVEPADDVEIVIPHALLEAAEIPVDGEISIQCVSGMIMISSADPLDVVPPCLMNLFDEMGIDHDTVRAVLAEGGF